MAFLMSATLGVKRDESWVIVSWMRAWFFMVCAEGMDARVSGFATP